MTLEERAETIIHHFPEVTFPEFVNQRLFALIVFELRAAVLAERERCAQACDAIADDKHAQYKGRPPHAPENDRRADPYTEGESSGAELCALAIRALD